MENLDEEWKPVVGYEGLYEVSSHGRVKSLPRLRVRYSRILKHGTQKHGHKIVTLCDRGSRKSVSVHHLVMRAFIGPAPVGMEICHGDGDPANNHLWNLRYDTHANNQAQRAEHGTHMPCEMNPAAKLTNTDVREIRRLVSNGETRVSVAKKYGVHRKTVGRIILGQHWSELPN